MNERIKKIEQLLQHEFQGDSSGHDWYHLTRVRALAVHIAKNENVKDLELIELAALLHDVPDIKLNSSYEEGQQRLKRIVDELTLSNEMSLKLVEIIASISYNGGHEHPLSSIEAKIVRDADRLDAIGAIGIARTFAYGGSVGNAMYEPELSVREYMTLEEYRNGKTSTVNHFYEKLLKLKDLMQTETGRHLAIERHQFMEQFLEQFFQEWKGLK